MEMKSAESTTARVHLHHSCSVIMPTGSTSNDGSWRRTHFGMHVPCCISTLLIDDRRVLSGTCKEFLVKVKSIYDFILMFTNSFKSTS